MARIPVRTMGCLILLTALVAGIGLAQTERTVRITVPEGTVVPVNLDTSLSSARNQQGDQFTVTVRSERQGDAEFPIGAKIEGVVIEAQRAAKKQPGMLDLDFREVRLADGQTSRIAGSLISLDSKNVKQTTEGRIIARNNNKKDRTKFIAIGAGAGLIIGKLTKHTLEGTLLGAAAGYLYSDRQRNKAADVTVREGTEFGVRLDRELVYYSPRAFAVARQSYRYYPPRPIDDSRISNEIRVTINREPVFFDKSQPLIEENGNILVPLSPVLDAARVRYRYDEARKTVRLETDRGELYLRIGRPYALLDGEREALEASAEERNGEVYVPLRFLALATGMRVMWDSPTETVVVTTN